MTKYFRVGNTTMTEREILFTSPEKLEQIRIDAEKANQKRLENIRKSLGIKGPVNLTLDVTPKGIAARKAAIEAEEAKIATETKAIAEEIGPETTSFVAEAEAPAKTKKSKNKKIA